MSDLYLLKFEDSMSADSADPAPSLEEKLPQNNALSDSIEFDEESDEESDDENYKPRLFQLLKKAKKSDEALYLNGCRRPPGLC